MALFPTDIIRPASYSPKTSRATSHGLSSTPEINTAVQFKGQTQFSTTDSYKQFRSEMLNLLRVNNFSPDQAAQIAEISTLPMDQLVRVILLAKALQRDKALFMQFGTIIRNIIARGDNLQEGLKSFLMGLKKSWA